MILLKINAKFCVPIIIILIIVPITHRIEAAQSNEDLLYMTNLIPDGGILESHPVFDSDGNLHAFLHVNSAEGNRLIHLYYVDGTPVTRVIVENAIGVEIRYVFPGGMIYSELGDGGELVFYKYVIIEQL